MKFSSTLNENQEPHSSPIDADIRRKMLRNSDPINKQECNALEVICVPYQSHSSAIFPIQHEKLKKNSTRPSNEQHNVPEVIFVPINSTDQTNLVVKPDKKIIPATKPSDTSTQDLNWSWSSDIFINGELITNGMLVDKSWVLVDKTIFNGRPEPLHEDYVVALFGNSRSQLKIESPYEQLRKIDCLHNLNNTNAMLLHLQTPVDFNRYVVPGFIPSL